ncbi:MAG TPA: epoxide hydrolase [Bacteroidales bacterium]|nr:epoxide hydrolase [Bacteroidales bacterium]
MISPFKIFFEDARLNDLKSRIRNTRWPDAIPGSGWQHGSDLAYIKDLTEYWLNVFDWRNTEDTFNSFTNYIGTIKGYNIHFIYVKGNSKQTIPLIITHGWPYSVLEMLKIIPLLTSGNEMAFDLVIPSMMGYGFSQKVIEPGCNAFLMAELWHELMKELGYNRYGVQGGDFGAGISAAIAYKYPESVIGMHLNYVPGYYDPMLEKEEILSDGEKAYLIAEEDWYMREGSYSHQQRTRPLTLAYGLNDSPVGLCAWIVEKMRAWADCKGDIESVFTKDELLSNVTLYWLTETIHSSARLYYENSLIKLKPGRTSRIQVPAGFARFRFEEPFPPREFVERGFKIARWTEYPVGGHFPAMEQPELLAKDIIEFFRQITS